jgi:hypothetical protein
MSDNFITRSGMSVNDNLTTEKSTITITFGDVAENHVGMQAIGKKSINGFTLEDLIAAKKKFEEYKFTCELINISEEACKGSTPQQNHGPIMQDPAYILIIRQGARTFVGSEKVDDLYKEQKGLNWDSKAFMKGKVVNKIARHNLCYDNEDQEPDYGNKKGRIISWKHIPYLNLIKSNLHVLFGDNAKDLKAEGNYYYDVNSCYIKPHGDCERRKVIAVRLGGSMPLHFQWYYDWKIISEKITIMLNHGDMYMMNEKAVGCDWKKPSIITVRHSAGFKIPEK